MTASEQIIRVLDELCKRFGIIVDWSKENAFPYIEQLMHKIVSYELWTSAAWVIVSIVVGYFTVRLIRWLIPGIKTHDWTSNDIYCVGAIISCFLSIVVIVMFLWNLMEIVTCLTFPEKIVYEYVSNLLTAK